MAVMPDGVYATYWHHDDGYHTSHTAKIKSAAAAESRPPETDSIIVYYYYFYYIVGDL